TLVRSNVIHQSVEFFDALYINRPRIILAIEDNHHLVLPLLLSNQHINLAFLLAVPTIQFCVVNHLGIRRKLLLNLRHQNFQFFSVRSPALPPIPAGYSSHLLPTRAETPICSPRSRHGRVRRAISATAPAQRPRTPRRRLWAETSGRRGRP